MLFIPTLPVKAEFTAMVRMISCVEIPSSAEMPNNTNKQFKTHEGLMTQRKKVFPRAAAG